MKCNQEILVAAARFAGESTCIISVQSANRFHYDMEIICAGQGWHLLLILVLFLVGSNGLLDGIALNGP